jgi:predicted transcriptional regulator
MNSQQEPKQGKRDLHQVEAAISEIGDQVEKLATKTAESIKKAIDKAMASRNTVLTIRVTEESNKKLNMLAESGLFKSRSESAAFLIEEGIRGQEVLFTKIKDKLETIDKIREELKTIVRGEDKAKI